MKDILRLFVFGLFLMTGSFAITVGLFADSQPEILKRDCKAYDAECTINSSDKPCCDDMVCVPFNPTSGNGKCGYLPTATPINTPVITNTNIPTNTLTPTSTQVMCQPTIVVGDCVYELVNN